MNDRTALYLSLRITIFPLILGIWIFSLSLVVLLIVFYPREVKCEQVLPIFYKSLMSGITCLTAGIILMLIAGGSGMGLFVRIPKSGAMMVRSPTSGLSVRGTLLTFGLVWFVPDRTLGPGRALGTDSTGSLEPRGNLFITVLV